MSRQDGDSHLHRVSTASGPWVALLLALLLAFRFASAAVGEAGTLLLVRPADSDTVALTEAAFSQRLQERCAQHSRCPAILTTTPDGLRDALQGNPALIVAFGQQASSEALLVAPGRPQLHTLISERLHAEHVQRRHELSAIYMEQPLDRQFRFIRFLMPEKRRLGVLLSEQSMHFKDRLTALADEYAFALHIETVSSGSEIGRQLHALNGKVDVLLSLPDPLIYNPRTLGTILLTSYRDNIPVIGFSAGMIKAGAVAGIYSSASSVGREAADTALDLLADHPPVSTHPRLFEVAVNRRVAGALHQSLPTNSEIDRWREDQ